MDSIKELLNSPIVLSTVLIVIVLSTGYLLRNLIEQNISGIHTQYSLLQALAAAELCAVANEFDPATALSSPIRLVIHFIAWNVLLWWFATNWGVATANPVTEFEDVFDGKDSIGNAIIIVAAEICGGLLGNRFMLLLYHLVSAEKSFACPPAFSESIQIGMAVEALGTFLCRAIAYTIPNYNRRPHIMFFKACLMLCICFAGMQYSCGCYNPMMATVKEVFCGTGAYEVFGPVFWGGPFIGAVICCLSRPVLDKIKDSLPD